MAGYNEDRFAKEFEFKTWDTGNTQPDGRVGYEAGVSVIVWLQGEMYSVTLRYKPTFDKAEFNRQCDQAYALSQQLASSITQVSVLGPTK